MEAIEHAHGAPGDCGCCGGEEETDIKKMILRLIFGGVLFICAQFLIADKTTSIIVFAVAYIGIAYDITINAVKNVLKGEMLDENFLMSIAGIGAFLIGQYGEGVAVILFYTVGELLQESAVSRSRKSISNLLDIRPDYANVLRNGVYEKVSPESVLVGDLIEVLPGEKIPLDGVVTDGFSMVDTKALTGESVPRSIKISDDVLSGSININGVIKIKVLKTFGESTVSKILNLVENASAKKSKTEQFITKFAKVYTPIVVVSALLVAVVPPLILDNATFSEWIYKALMLLVISCPCALVISIPLGFFAGIGASSNNGILVKGSNYLDALKDVDTVVFDKTGTLTKGVFSVTELVPKNNFTSEELIRFAAYAESYSSHPIAISILKHYGAQVDKSVVKNYEQIVGLGIKATIDEKEVLAGSRALMLQSAIDFTEISTIQTVVHVSVSGIYAGYLSISDIIKEDSKEAISALKAIGAKKIVMLTGDNKKIAKQTAETVGITDFFAELLPHEKVEKVELLLTNMENGKKLAFVGDGINDAPVLMRADVGIAMGGIGSDAAIEAADIVIMNDEPSKIAKAIKIALKTKTIVWQNIVFSIGIKLIVMAVALFAPVGVASIWEAVFADVGVAIIAILNSIRVLK